MCRAAKPPVTRGQQASTAAPLLGHQELGPPSTLQAGDGGLFPAAWGWGLSGWGWPRAPGCPLPGLQQGSYWQKQIHSLSSWGRRAPRCHPSPCRLGPAVDLQWGLHGAGRPCTRPGPLARSRGLVWGLENPPHPPVVTPWRSLASPGVPGCPPQLGREPLPSMCPAQGGSAPTAGLRPMLCPAAGPPKAPPPTANLDP